MNWTTRRRGLTRAFLPAVRLTSPPASGRANGLAWSRERSGARWTARGGGVGRGASRLEVVCPSPRQSTVSGTRLGASRAGISSDTAPAAKYKSETPQGSPAAFRFYWYAAPPVRLRPCQKRGRSAARPWPSCGSCARGRRRLSRRGAPSRLPPRGPGPHRPRGLCEESRLAHGRASGERFLQLSRLLWH